MEFRIRQSGAVVSDDELRAEHPTVALPAVLDAATLDALGADPVLASPPPDVTEFQSALRDGVVQDGLGNWVYAWRVEDWTQEQIDAALRARVPAQVTMRQARLALLGAGKLSQVQPAIDALPSPQKEQAQIEWEYSQSVQRHRGLVSTIGASLGLTDASIDALFITAATL